MRRHAPVFASSGLTPRFLAAFLLFADPLPGLAVAAEEEALVALLLGDAPLAAFLFLELEEEAPPAESGLNPVRVASAGG